MSFLGKDIWVECALLCFKEEGKLGIKYSLRYLCHELLHQTSAIDSLFFLKVLVYELDTKVLLRIQFIYEYIIESIFNDIVSSYWDNSSTVVETVVIFGFQMV